MKTPRLLLVLLLATLSLPAMARKDVLAVAPEDSARADLVTVLVPEAIDVEMVDGIDHPGLRALFRRGDMGVKMLPGERELAVRYKNLFQLTADDHEIVKSKVIVLTFIGEPGKTYRLVHPEFRDVRAARDGVKNLVLKIMDDQGVNRVVGAKQVNTTWQGESTVTTRKDLVSPAAVAAVAVVAAPVTAPAAPVPGVVPGTGNAAAGSAAGSNALEFLKFSWKSATAADRAAFLEWAKANP